MITQRADRTAVKDKSKLHQSKTTRVRTPPETPEKTKRNLAAMKPMWEHRQRAREKPRIRAIHHRNKGTPWTEPP